VILNPVVWMGCWTAALSGQALVRRLGGRGFGAGWIVLGGLALLVKARGPGPERADVVASVVLAGIVFVPLIPLILGAKPEKGKAP
jgi:hypothetical protein